MSDVPRLHAILRSAWAALEDGRQGEALQGLAALPAAGASPECAELRARAKRKLKNAVHDAASGADLAYGIGAALLSLGDVSAAEDCARALWKEPPGAAAYRRYARAGDAVQHCRATGVPVTELPQFPAASGPQSQATRSAFLLTLREASVLGCSFLPVTRSGVVLTERCMESSPKLERFSGVEQLDMVRIASDAEILATDGPRERHAGRHVVIGNHDNIGHWLLFYFSRMLLLEGRNDFADARFVVGENLKQLHIDCFERFGVAESRLVRLPRGRLAEFEELCVPSFLTWVAQTGHLYSVPEVVRFIRRALRVPARRAGGNERIFLGRRGTQWRRLLNEAEVFGALEQAGFVDVDPGKLTLQEQIDVAASARIIVACLGAGVNLHLFAPLDAAVVQIQPEERPNMNPHPWLAGLLGQRFYQAVGETAGTHSDPLKSDYWVSPARVLEAVAAAQRG